MTIDDYAAVLTRGSLRHWGERERAVLSRIADARHRAERQAQRPLRARPAA